MLVSATMSNGPVMIYSGQEFGEKGMDNEGFSGIDGRTSIFAGVICKTENLVFVKIAQCDAIFDYIKG